MENNQWGCFPTSDHMMCEENIEFFEDDNTGKGIEELARVSGGDDDDYIRKLLHRESNYDYVNGGLQLQKDSWILRARLDGIYYILKKSVLLGFMFRTAYMSVAYLDKFLSKRSIADQENSWAVRLLSVACLSLAAKMEEVSVPPLSELCVLDEYSFESCVIQRMELLVLSELGWTMGFITPFSFIDFFADKLFDYSAPRNAGDSSIELLILGATKDIKIMCHKPSAIAAAATLYVIDQGLTMDALNLRIESLASSLSLDIENIVTCYYQIRELEIETSNTDRCITSPDSSSPFELQRSEPYGIISSAKQKRLVFNQNDGQFDGGLHDKKGKP